MREKSLLKSRKTARCRYHRINTERATSTMFLYDLSTLISLNRCKSSKQLEYYNQQ